MSDSKIPEICDFDCPYADFPPAETAGICRTMSAVWCGKLGELVNKNMPCEYRARGGGQATGAKRGAKKSGAKKSGRKSARKKSAGKTARKTGGAKKTTRAKRKSA